MATRRRIKCGKSRKRNNGKWKKGKSRKKNNRKTRKGGALNDGEQLLKAFQEGLEKLHRAFVKCVAAPNQNCKVRLDLTDNQVAIALNALTASKDNHSAFGLSPDDLEKMRKELTEQGISGAERLSESESSALGDSSSSYDSESNLEDELVKDEKNKQSQIELELTPQDYKSTIDRINKLLQKNILSGREAAGHTFALNIGARLKDLIDQKRPPDDEESAKDYDFDDEFGHDEENQGGGRRTRRNNSRRKKTLYKRNCRKGSCKKSKKRNNGKRKTKRYH